MSTPFKNPTKHRGAISNPAGRFEKTSAEYFDDGWALEEETLPFLQTTVFPERAKSIISRNDSPDLGFEQSINPYRGCEHGCIYCYARPSHAYVNLSPGLDFETKLFYKVGAAELLVKELNHAKYVCKPIVLGANTDPYQPLESKLNITRSILEVCLEYKHPISIITKNSLIVRDLDILRQLAQDNLVKVAISITTLSKALKMSMEPRTSTPQGRLHAARKLTEVGIPVRVMVAPIIPVINDMELEKILEAANQHGVTHASYVLVRLPHEVKDLFKEWLTEHFPLKVEHVMSIIRQMRGGKEYDATYGKRMRGEGQFAQLLETRFRIACKRFHLNQTPSLPLNTQLFKKKDLPFPHQLSFFDEY